MLPFSLGGGGISSEVAQKTQVSELDFLKIYLFIYLTAPGLINSHSMQDLELQHAGYNFLTRD